MTTEDIHHKLAGQRFKRGFGGVERRYVGAYDYVYNPLQYRLLSAVWGWLSRSS